MSEPYVGEIRLGGWNFAPVGWAFCNGAVVAISQNEVLFNLIGTTYGGDGVNTYNLPDLQGRLPVHFGSDPNGNPYVIGQLAGTETVTLTTSQMPAHNHAFEATTSAATSRYPTAKTLASSSANVYVPPTSPVTTSASTSATGGGQPHDNVMPFLCVNFIISLFGIFPSQS